MTFQQHVDAIGNLVLIYNLEVSPQNSNSQKVKGSIESRNVSIFIDFMRQTIMWADSSTGEYKNFNY